MPNNPPGTPASKAQYAAALSLIRSGVSLQLFGLVWGMFVPQMPFPRLGLTAHIQCMVEGAMLLLAGILMNQRSLLALSPLQTKIVWGGLTSLLITMAAECINAFWGTNQILPIAASQAGALGALPWQEQVMTLTHIVPSMGMIVGMGVLAWSAWTTNVAEVEERKGKGE